MSEMNWKEIAEYSDLSEGKPKSVEVDGQQLAVFLVDDEVHVCGPNCTHYGAELANGVVHGKIVTCPWHGARFDVATGEVLNAPALDSVACYPVKVEDGKVYVGEAEKPKIEMPSGDDDRTFLIIGAGASGNAAAETLRREGFAGKILMITPEQDRPYDRTKISKSILSGADSPDRVHLRREKFYRDLQIEILKGKRVVALNPDEGSVKLDHGESLTFDKVLLATGGTPRKLPIPGTDLKGVYYLRNLEDARGISAAAMKAKNIVVIGTGFIGMEAAASLTEARKKVHVVAPESVPMSRVFGERVGKWFQAMHEKKGVVFHLGPTAEKIEGDGKAEGVVLSDGERLEADLVIIGIGINLCTEYLEGTGLAEKGAVPVDGRFRTKRENVFATGDIAVFPHHETGEPMRVEHWAVAEDQGMHAARCMLGSEVHYKEPPFFWTRQFGKSLQYCGYVRGFDDIQYEGEVEEGEFVAKYLVDGKLKAAAVVGIPNEVFRIAEELRG